MSSPRMSWSTLYWKVLFQVGVSYICWLRLTWWLQLCGALWPVLGDESWCFPACGLRFKPERRNWDRWEWQLVSSICSNFLMAIEIDVDVCGKRSLYVVGKTKTRHLKLLKSSKLIKLVWISNKKLKYLYFILCSRKYLNLKHDIIFQLFILARIQPISKDFYKSLWFRHLLSKKLKLCHTTICFTFNLFK